jgi:putative ABC transport system substrate-binding protein
LGWSDGHNVRIDIRWSENDVDRDRKYAAELIALAPDVVLAGGTLSVAALQHVSRTLPIVFVGVSDPVGAGFVDTLSRPGGNVTGFMIFEYSMSGKWLELLKQIAPGVTRAAILRSVRRHPGHGAVAWGGGEPGQHSRRRRDRTRRRGLRPLLKWRPDRNAERREIGSS